jgi:predicted extracellular nuclease
VLDYNTDFKRVGQMSSLYNADFYRVSDHDSVIIGMNLVASAPTATPTATQMGGALREGSNETW